MDEVWEAFEEVNSKYNNAFVADREQVSVLCSFGETEAEAFKQMATLMADVDFVTLLSVNGEYTDDSIYALTVVVSHLRLS